MIASLSVCLRVLETDVRLRNFLDFPDRSLLERHRHRKDLVNAFEGGRDQAANRNDEGAIFLLLEVELSSHLQYVLQNQDARLKTHLRGADATRKHNNVVNADAKLRSGIADVVLVLDAADKIDAFGKFLLWCKSHMFNWDLSNVKE